MTYFNLREIRNKREISVKELTEALGLKTEAAYYKKESGMVKFSLQEAKIIADIMDMPIETIFFGQNVSCKDTKYSSTELCPTGTE